VLARDSTVLRSGGHWTMKQFSAKGTDAVIMRIIRNYHCLPSPTGPVLTQLTEMPLIRCPEFVRIMLSANALRSYPADVLWSVVHAKASTAAVSPLPQHLRHYSIRKLD